MIPSLQWTGWKINILNSVIFLNSPPPITLVIMLTQFSPAHNSETEFFLFTENGVQFLVKRYMGVEGGMHRDREKARMLHWKSHDLFVPTVYEKSVSQVGGVYLVMDYLPGSTLGELVVSESSRSQIYRWVELVLRCNAARHRLSMMRSDALLIHPDPNPYNVLIAGERIQYIDFESSVKNTSLDELISLEVERFVLRLLRLLGDEHVQDLSKMLVSAYDGQEAVLERIIENNHVNMLVRKFKNFRKSMIERPIGRYELSTALREHLK